MKDVDTGEPTSFLDHVYFGLHSTRMRTKILWTILVLHPEKLGANINSWSCVERYYELANRTTQQLFKVATPCLDDHQFKEEEMGSVGELSKVCSQIVLKWLYLARFGRPDILWSVNKLARAVTKWTRASDKRSARLILHEPHE